MLGTPKLSRAQRQRLTALLALLLSLFSLPLRADGGDAGAGVERESKLPELPQVPSLEIGDPTPEDLEALDGFLKRITSPEIQTRKTASKEVLEATPGWVPAIDHRINQIADKANKEAMKRELTAIRKQARSDVREEMKAAGKRGKVKTPDYLDMLVDNARPQSEDWKHLISVVGMSRVLRQIGSVEAARELVDVYVRFGEFLRVDTQLQLEAMGDKALAALIEARRHKAEKIARWADRQLDVLGKAIPSEAVQTEDYEVLADVLRAYGRIRDPDAARIIISFANTERAQVREAARQAVALLGEVGNWQLRDSYETILGKKPPRDWDWKRTARELFGEFDRMRLAEVYRLYDSGLAAHKQGDLPKMRDDFNKLLARSPLFEHRGDLVSGYLAFARKYFEDKPGESLDALRRAARLADKDHSARKQIDSLLLTQEGEALLEKGIVDQVLFRRAIELDPSNRHARDALARAERGELKKQSEFNRYAAAGAIGAVALLAIAVIGLRRRHPPVEARSDPDTKPDEPAKEEPEPAEPEKDEPGVESDAPNAELDEPAEGEAATHQSDSQTAAAPTKDADPEPAADPASEAGAGNAEDAASKPPSKL